MGNVFITRARCLQKLQIWQQNHQCKVIKTVKPGVH